MVVLGRRLGSSAVSRWLAASLLLASLLPATTAGAAGFTVASGGDGVDVAPGNGACADAGGACTLRAAIMEANATPDADRIRFEDWKGGVVPVEVEIEETRPIAPVPPEEEPPEAKVAP